MLIKVDWNSKKSLKEAVAPKLNDNFWKWFGNSKVVDEQGKPLVVYHGSLKTFNQFKSNSQYYDIKGNPIVSDKRVLRKIIWFSDNKNVGEGFGSQSRTLKNLYSCFLKIENPFIYDAKNNQWNAILELEILKKCPMSCDGIIIKNIKEGSSGNIIANDYIVFNPNQIKSVDNNGEWSSTSDNINEWWSGGVNWKNDREGLGGVGATMDCHLFFFMFPDQFLNLCPKFSYGDDEFFNQYVADRKSIGIPFLWCDIDEKNKIIKVKNHEGRHRVKAIRHYAASRGKMQPDIPVAIIYSKDKYHLPTDVMELRKNWKIISQNGDRTYNIGQFTVQHNLDDARIGLDNLYESIKSLYSNSSTKIITTDSECANWIKNNPNNRLMYDTNKKWYIVSNNINDDIHIFMIEDAIRDGYYPEFIEKYGKRLNHDVMGEVGTEIINKNPDRFLLLRGLTKDNEELMTDGYQDKYDCGDFYIFCIKNEFEKIPVYKYFKAKLTESTEPNEPNLNQNFWNWFKGSKTIDEQGNPLIFYHGTKQPNITNFKAKYDDGLVFFAYNEEFAKEWASNAPLTPDQEQGVRDFQGSDDLANYRKEVMDRYKRDYGDNWADDEDIRKAAKWEIKEYEKQKYKQMGIEENVMPVYIRATKIFNPARDYEQVIDKIAEHWDIPLKPMYEKEEKEAQEKFDKIHDTLMIWFKNHLDWANDPVLDKEFKKREDILDNAFKELEAIRNKNITIKDHLSRIKKGAWIYFENKETIDKIWELGYDAIELAEHDGEISTLAVREGTNQVKSIFNYGEWGKSNNIMEAGYQGYSKSNNAVNAESEGKYPASTAAKMLGVSTEAIKTYIPTSEWHHYSSYYNEVYVYDITPYLMLKNGKDMSEDYDDEEIAEYKANYQAMKNMSKQSKSQKENEKKYKANVEWIEWEGTRKHPIPNVQKYENIWVKEKGDFYTFILPNKTEVRKKKGSNGTYVRPYEEVKKAEKEKKDQLKIAKERYKIFRKNTSRKALKFIYDNKLDSNSNGTHYYIMGRKPNSWAYQQLDQWFEKGELRLSSKNPDFMSSAGAYLEQWDGEKWVAIESIEPTIEGNNYLSFYYIEKFLKK